MCRFLGATTEMLLVGPAEMYRKTRLRLNGSPRRGDGQPRACQAKYAILSSSRWMMQQLRSQNLPVERFDVFLSGACIPHPDVAVLRRESIHFTRHAAQTPPVVYILIRAAHITSRLEKSTGGPFKPSKLKPAMQRP